MPQDGLSLPFSGKKLRDLRERAGLTRPGLAKRCADLGCSVTPQHIARLERDEHRPGPPLLVAFAQAIGRDVDDLLEPSAGAA